MVYNPQGALENNKYTMGPTRTLGVHPSLSLDMGSMERVDIHRSVFVIVFNIGMDPMGFV